AVVATDAGGSYTANPFPASATVTGVPADGTLATSPSPTISFTYTNMVTLASSSTAPSSPGSYTVVAPYTSTNPNYTNANSPAAAFSLRTAKLTVVATDAGGSYTANPFPASATVTGVPADGTLATSPSSTITFTYTNTVTLATSSTAP